MPYISGPFQGKQPCELQWEGSTQTEVPARGSLWPVSARDKSLGGFSLFFLWNNLLSSSARNVILRRHKGKKNIKKLNPSCLKSAREEFMEMFTE